MTSPIFNGLLVQKEHLSAGKSRSAETPRQCIGVINAATRIAWTVTASASWPVALKTRSSIFKAASLDPMLFGMNCSPSSEE